MWISKGGYGCKEVESGCGRALTICLSALELVKKRCRRCPLICLSAVKEVIKALQHRPFDLFLACSKEVKNCSPVTILICLSAMEKRA